MNCPYCGYENIQGADNCSECGNDLTFLDSNPAIECEVEKIIIQEPVKSLNPRTPICVSPKTAVREVLEILIEKRIGCVLVMEETELVGIFTERDLLVKIAGTETEVEDQPVENWMTPAPASVDHDDSIAFAIHKLDVGGYRHLPVMHGNNPTGIISVRDVMRFLADHLATVES